MGFLIAKAYIQILQTATENFAWFQCVLEKFLRTREGFAGKARAVWGIVCVLEAIFFCYNL
ncbi:hypothetical protein A3J61_02165 [Candidatus Nomurabacteria bacterium RIFCSPHIGHO2_02_FULL_38_15]|uniref:Uncharacterized protein n=1 Tax=Candidatus Nomurabacteria bacterium RIFCSPHIGHO2_02_FULL_38_15 TaxID=1801752 RepID=A0A1F6VRJ9_9BACT|nr:MAG: hypothetical protein A3J61_02165 [Candidatus Nomurabacteria bacterium RIFCSPHIGHO2_02_FULL_38_15]